MPVMVALQTRQGNQKFKSIFSQLHSGFEAILGHRRPCLQKIKIKKRKSFLYDLVLDNVKLIERNIEAFSLVEG